MKRLNLKLKLGMAVIAALILVSLLAPIISPYPPNDQNLEEGLNGPSWSHPLGQDKFGRDILSRILYGARISLTVGLTTAVFSLVIGSILGAGAAYLGGPVDEALTRFMDKA